MGEHALLSDFSTLLEDVGVEADSLEELIPVMGINRDKCDEQEVTYLLSTTLHP